jgi:hypothetical protein
MATEIRSVIDQRAANLEEQEDLEPRYKISKEARPPKKLFRNYTKWKNLSDYEIINDRK